MASLHHHVAKKKVKKHLASSPSTRNYIDEAGKESFPSSDPPAWTLGSDHHKRLLSKEEKTRDLAYLLTQEHRLIRHVVHAMMALSADLHEGKAINMQRLTAISDFFIQYVDECHHKKEEMLFAAMRKGEERPSDYILNDLLREHEHGKEIHAKLAAWIKSKKQDKKELAKLLKGMINLHHNHTTKEEEYVFPLIHKVIGKEERDAFLLAFKKMEEDLGKGVYANLVDLSKRMK